jgi:hypothetical protein
MNTNTTKRQWLKRGGIAVAVLAGLYVAAWFATANVVRDGARAWLAQQQGGGLTIATGDWRTAGFPGRIVITVPDVVATAPVSAGGWVWRSPRILLSTTALAFHHLTVDFAGMHTLGYGDAPGGTVLLAADEARADIALAWGGRLRRSTLTATQLTVRLTQDGAPLVRIGSGRVDAEVLDKDGAPSTSPTLAPTARVELEARDVSLPPGLMPLETPIVRAALTAELTGTWSAGSLPQVLDLWRAGGGTVEIRSAALDWAPIRVAGSGTFALDEKLQPTGAASLRVQGGAELMDGLAKAGVLSAQAASVARLGLALLMRPNAAGVQELNVPLTLQDRAVSAGPLQLGTLREITWPPLAVP